MKMKLPLLLPLAALLLAAAACRPDQVEHLKDSKRIGVETANWEVKRIMPQDLLRATRWAGDSLTAFADTLLRRRLAQALARGGVAEALPLCRPEAYAATDSMARILHATAARLSARPRNPTHRAALPPPPAPGPDTARRVARPSQEVFTYQRPIILNSGLCLRCHGEVGKDIAKADYALIRKAYPQDQATGYQRGQPLGAWQVQLARPGVAGFWTMKTRKKWKPRKQLPKLF